MRFAIVWVSLLSCLSARSWGSTTQTTCQNIFDRIAVPYLKLYHKLSDKTGLDPRLGLFKMIRQPRTVCDSESTRSSFTKVVLDALSDHTARIGVLVPLSGPHASEGRALLKGIQGFYPFRGIAFNQRVIVEDSAGLVPVAERGLASLIYKHRVSLIIGGVVKENAQVLQSYAESLRLPILLTSGRQSTQIYPNVFHVFPDEHKLANDLADYVRSRGLKRIGILKPAISKGRKFSDLFAEALKGHGIDVSQTFQYNSGDYYSLEGAAEMVFKIDRSLRAEEFQELIREARRKATLANVEFNPSSVALPPIVDVDAVFIDDNFRTVKHFAKIFKYLGVDKIKLLGTPQWRALGIIDPPMPYLEGAIFADYIGSYAQLPQGLAIAGLQSAYFVDPEVAAEVDYMVIGHQAAHLGDLALSKPLPKRRLLYKNLEQVKNEDSRYFEAGLAFNKFHHSHWPSFLFEVGPDNIHPIENRSRTSHVVIKADKRDVTQ